MKTNYQPVMIPLYTPSLKPIKQLNKNKLQLFFPSQLGHPIHPTCKVNKTIEIKIKLSQKAKFGFCLFFP